MSVLWILEFALECSGAIMASRRKLWVLSASLAWAALSDIVCFAIKDIHPTFGYAAWTFEAVQYLILCALACQIAGKLMSENPKLYHSAIAGAGVSGMAISVFIHEDKWSDKFLNAEIAASCILAGVTWAAYIMRKKELEGTWKIVGSGIIVLMTGTIACAALTSTILPDSGMALYSIPQLASLLLWNLAAWKPTKKESKWQNEMILNFQSATAEEAMSAGATRSWIWRRKKKPVRLQEIRLPLPARKPVASVKPERGVWVEPSRLKVN